MSDTRQRILDTARHLFNTQGLHRVGVRDLAYHFRTKGDRLAALVTELHELNQSLIFSGLPSDFSLITLYRAAVTEMRILPPILPTR